MAIEKQFKEKLGLLLAAGHARFGRVAPRRPYLDDDSGGEGAAGLRMEVHPLLADLPIGAASDLTAVITANSTAEEAALERVEELTPALRQQPALQAVLSNRQQYTPKISPY